MAFGAGEDRDFAAHSRKNRNVAVTNGLQRLSYLPLQGLTVSASGRGYNDAVAGLKA